MVSVSEPPHRRIATRYVLAPALAGALVALVDLLRTWQLEHSAFGSGGSLLGFAVTVLGVLALPLGLAGAGAIAAADLLLAGWRWGHGARLATARPERKVAWAVYGLLALPVLLLAVRQVTVRVLAHLHHPVYQGLAAGLAAIATVLALLLLSGPAIGLLERGLLPLRPRLPPWADPATVRGGLCWLALPGCAAALLGRRLFPELHTVDLGPATLLAAWVGLLLVLAAAGRRWARGRGVVPLCGLLVALQLATLGWAALARPEASRWLIIERDTLLAGPAGARLRRLADRDGDGVSGLFAGGDCDDHDPAIRPGEYDRPGDGLDQNCTGADLDLADDPAQPARRAAPAAPALPAPAWNVVLLTLDAVRGDWARQEMPQLMELAREGIDYPAAYSPATSTYRALPALMASRLPSRMEMAPDGSPAPAATLLAEVLNEAGWHTLFFTSFTRFFDGLRQGFESVDSSVAVSSREGTLPGAAAMSGLVLAALRAVPPEQRFFLWAHYNDAHDPYKEVPGFPAADGSDRARYRAALRYLDAEVARVTAALKAGGLWERTVLIVTADHGEEFEDHAHRFHGGSVYDEVIHVPLVLHVPGLPHRALTTPIGLAELAPTLLELLGVPIPASFTGRSRAEELRRGLPALSEPIFSEVFPDHELDVNVVAVRLENLKLIEHVADGSTELYDLARDPGERHNLRLEEVPGGERLHGLLSRYVDHQLWWLAQGKADAFRPPGSP